jgi:hypothetical protein
MRSLKYLTPKLMTNKMENKNKKTEISDVSKLVALKFVEVINKGDSEKLIKLQTEDFTLIDMAGNKYRGQDGWEDYFSTYPKYKIHVKHVLRSGNGVAIIGKTTDSNIPLEVEEFENVLWIAEIRDNLVAEWRIYSDIEEAKKKAQTAQ